MFVPANREEAIRFLERVLWWIGAFDGSTYGAHLVALRLEELRHE